MTEVINVKIAEVNKPAPNALTKEEEALAVEYSHSSIADVFKANRDKVIPDKVAVRALELIKK